MNTVTVKLGEKSYSLKPLALRKAKAWREKLKGPFGNLSKALLGAGDIKLTNSSDLSVLINTVADTVIDAPDMMFDMLCDYDEDIKRDREILLDTTNDFEVQAAFVEVVKLAFPFGKILSLIRSGQGQM